MANKLLLLHLVGCLYYYSFICLLLLLLLFKYTEEYMNSPVSVHA